MAKYMLFKYDEQVFESGDHIKMYPVKRIELTEEELKLIELFTNMLDIEQRVYKDLYPWLNNTNRLKVHAKIRKVLE